MFSIPHLVIIFVVVLVVFGPEKLPELARNLGKILGEFRRATGDLQNQFEGHLRDIERESSLRQTATAAGTTIAPPVKDTAALSQSKADSASAPGTVPGEAPHGWTVAPPNASASENGGTAAATSAEAPGATQADAAHLQPDAVSLTQEKPGQSSAAAVPEPGHEKGSDGGHPN
jgi:sec-independent protein translocase protein TatB